MRIENRCSARGKFYDKSRLIFVGVLDWRSALVAFMAIMPICKRKSPAFRRGKVSRRLAGAVFRPRKQAT